MGFGRPRRLSRLSSTVATLLVATATTVWAAEGIETSGDWSRHPLKELTDVPGPALLGKDFVLVSGTRRDDDYLRESFVLRKFAFDGKEDTTFSDLANTPAFLPRGGRRLGNYFQDLAGKLDPGAARSLRNYPSRVIAAAESGWIVLGRVGGDEGKAIPALLKCKADGTVDADFAKAGRAVLPPRHRITGITAAGLVGEKAPKVWIGLPAPKGFSVGRLDGKDGLDSTFGDDGYTLVELEGYDTVWPHRILGHADGSATVLGCATVRGKRHAVLTRLTPAGKVETEKFGDEGKGGTTYLRQTQCDSWVYAPRTNARSGAYYFAADTWAVATESGGIVVAVDGQDAVGDRVDAIFGAKSLGWKKELSGLVRLSANGTVDKDFGSTGVVVLEGPGKARVNVAGLGMDKDKVLWVAAVVRGEKGSSLAWARVDDKGKRLAWTKTTEKSMAKLDGDWLVFPMDEGRDLTVRAFRIEGAMAFAFGFAASREVPTDLALKWKLWKVSE